MGVILNHRGEPEVPDAIKRRLANLGAGLSLRLRGGVWWLMQRWPEGDHRWKWVQSNQLPESEAVDGLGAFPAELPFDQMPAFIEKSLREFPLRDLKRVASQFSKGETIGSDAEDLKHELFDETIKEAGSEGRVTGRRVIHKKAGQANKKEG